ncbi:hypothetical protein EDD80_11553 [Anseongella ginsenosidimutans]|uniref:Uncharacterized protein n=1 Tax=Anseongella ginsenosidimutans TaxID=496056 RepID=A0A4R3KML3_9SPHI|nr:hypothetical protein [Anseongella ginsenosidimutans]QEC51906.1 hypothetical protein FRZ59_05865 [Anseongella ginsenosidimutans]TCS85070.1 hypothetical protein EDD80_11553 [Anseongella ginsenosidimutans]
MFFSIRQHQIAAHETEGLENPKNPGNKMELVLFRTKGRTLFHTSHTKQAFGEYWDVAEGKKISKRLWTSRMKAYCAQKAKEAPKPPFFFKITIAGWIFLLACFAVLGFIVYDENKPPLPKSEDVAAKEQPLAEGDIFFGHFEEYKESEQLGRISAGVGHGWFKILKVENDTYHVAKSTEMSKSHRPKEQMDSTSFEMESIPAKIEEKGAYTIRLLSADGNTEFAATSLHSGG